MRLSAVKTDLVKTIRTLLFSNSRGMVHCEILRIAIGGSILPHGDPLLAVTAPIPLLRDRMV